VGLGMLLYGVQPPVPIVGRPVGETLPLGDIPHASLDHSVGHIIESRIQVGSGRSFGQARGQLIKNGLLIVGELEAHSADLVKTHVRTPDRHRCGCLKPDRCLLDKTW
jgi:hypothetical protein